MKKIFCFLAALFVLTGCSCNNELLMNTPTKKVEMFLANYQTLDADVLKQLDDIIEDAGLFTDKQKDTYRSVMKKHYQNLTYEIKDEVTDGDKATVTTEIEVDDYTKSIKETTKYREEHEDEFLDVNGKHDPALFLEYQLEKIKKVEDRVTYTIDFTLTKVKDEWKLDKLTKEQESKIHGTYNY